MKRWAFLFALSLGALSSLSFGQAQDPPAAGPRCPREACAAALRDYKGGYLLCHASYAQLDGRDNDVWLVSIDTGSSKEYRGVDAKTGEVLPNVDPARAKRCGPRPFHCPDWVYQSCPE